MTYVVGYSPDYHDTQPLDLAAQLARTDGDALRVVIAVPQGWGTPAARGTDVEFETFAARWGDSAAAEATAHLSAQHPDISAEVVWLPARSAASALMAEAEAHDARLIVVGSGENGSAGKIVMSSVNNRILHSSHIPVAIAPRLYRADGNARIRRVTCAFRDDESSHAAALAAAEVCDRIGASLRLVTFGIRGPRMLPAEISGAEVMVNDAFVEQSMAAQAEVVAEITARGMTAVESRAVSARTWAGGFEQLPWHKEDILVVGSSSTGRFARVFLGSNATKIVSHSPVPVLVVP